jgi:hypothetical protein
MLAGLTISVAPMASATGLGLVISLESTGETDAESSGRIWGGGEAGTSFTRVMNIQSLSTDTIQEISFEINDQVTENDTSFIDYSTPSRITDWIVFEPANPLLNPGESARVTVTFNIPPGTNDGAFNANIRTFSTAAVDPDAQASDAGTQAVIGTRLALDARVWLGVGDALALAPKFDIVGVDGALINEEKFVRVFFENTGISPVQPVGRLQLSDPNFVDRTFEPVDFTVPEIQGGEIAFVDIPVAADLEDGFFRVFVTAQSGEVRITRLFEATLVFDDPNKLAISDLAIRIAGFVLAALGLVFGVRLIRGSGQKVAKEPREPKGSRPARVKAVRKPRQLLKLRSEPEATKVEDPMEAIQAAIARMEKQFQELNQEIATAKPAPRRKPSPRPKAAPKPKSPPAPQVKKPVTQSAKQPSKKAPAKDALSSSAVAEATVAKAARRPATPKAAQRKITATPKADKVASSAKQPVTRTRAKDAVARATVEKTTATKPAAKKKAG